MRVACVQMNSSESWQHNLKEITSYVQQAARADVQLLLFPENMMCMGAGSQQKKDMAQYYDTIIDSLAQTAAQHQVHIIAGSLICEHEQQLFNRSVAVSNQGQVLATYDKIHLFDAIVAQESYRESELFSAGARPTWLQVEQWKIGLSICYDLRFPELYRHYAVESCNMLCIPAAFTYQTGQAHWECLLRSRAIENQCYVLAAGQWGTHADGRQTWGHSMIIDPWGTILACKESGAGLVVADMDEQQLAQIRQQLPVLQHRRLH